MESYTTLSWCNAILQYIYLFNDSLGLLMMIRNCVLVMYELVYGRGSQFVSLSVMRLINTLNVIRDLLHRMCHYSDVIMSAMASQINGIASVYPTVCSSANQRKHRMSASLAFVKGIHRWPVKSRQKGPVTRKMFLFDDVIKVEAQNRDPSNFCSL